MARCSCPTDPGSGSSLARIGGRRPPSGGSSSSAAEPRPIRGALGFAVAGRYDPGATMSDQRPPEEPPASVPPPPSEMQPPADGVRPPVPPDATQPVISTGTREPRSRAATIALLVGAAVLILGVAAASAAYFLLRGSSEAVLNKVPSGADFVAVAHLDPAASQKMNLFRMTE